MITKLFNHPHLINQVADTEFDMPETAIGASIDNGGLIVLEQEGRHICINPKSVKDLVKVLRILEKAT